MTAYDEFISWLSNQKEAGTVDDTAVDYSLLLLDKAKELRLKHATHNQASHGFRFGKTPSLEQARRYRKAGVLQEYSKRSRERSGTKPSKQRQAEKPKAETFMGRELSPKVSNVTQTKKAITFWDRLNGRYPHKEIGEQINRLFDGKAEYFRNGGLIYGLFGFYC